ncbi:MAG: ROK family protein [Gemmatimonadales bacterium]|nr:MAG: ROK family protein [Gemmatimonadales bacterium]
MNQAPFILADIGGTYARFAMLGEGTRDLRSVRVFRCAEFPTLEAALGAYLATAPMDGSAYTPAGLCLALPGPVDREEISLPNNPWRFSPSSLETSLGAPVTLINDFVAQALATDLLTPDEIRFTGDARPDRDGIRVVLGPGTGLGVAVRKARGQVMPSEAGHTGFSPSDRHQIELMRVLFRRFPRVSVERLVSGPGLVNLYEVNRELAGGAPAFQDNFDSSSDGQVTDELRERVSARPSPAQVSERAGRGDPVAQRAIQDFFDVLASFAGDMALAVWASGGVFISGAVVQKLSPFLDEAQFRRRFSEKGRLSEFCAGVTIGWVQVAEPGLLGCAARMMER